MIFSSPLFLFLFLPAVLFVYFLLPGIRAKNIWLLLASLGFYAWGELDFLAMLLLSVLANFFLARILDRQTNKNIRKWVLALGVAGNLGLLVLFKYTNPVINLVLHLFGSESMVTVDFFALPLGISFFTFHALSYLMDVYRQKQPAASRPGDLALYIFFFPQMIAGPILRWQAIAPQLRARNHSLEKFAGGTRRFIAGLAKKVLIANTLALPADQIFGLPANQLSTADAWLGAICYTLQIYYDFSGYSDMAIGMGEMLGFDFMENFCFPYSARSIRDFWHRWHISLSTWFRDYLYFPLGGNRLGQTRTCVNLFIVFFLCGWWHGANWTFVIWGLYHGLFLSLERTRFGSLLGRMPAALRHAYTLLVILIGWVIFRSASFTGAGHFYQAMAGLGDGMETQPCFRYATGLVMGTMFVGIIFSFPWWQNHRLKLTVRPRRFVFRAVFMGLETASILAVFLLSLARLAGETYQPFIYFRF